MTIEAIALVLACSTALFAFVYGAYELMQEK
jgi:hypothetical protein